VPIIHPTFGNKNILFHARAVRVAREGGARRHQKSGFCIPASKRVVGVSRGGRARPLAGILSLSPNPAKPLVTEYPGRRGLWSEVGIS